VKQPRRLNPQHQCLGNLSRFSHQPYPAVYNVPISLCLMSRFHTNIKSDGLEYFIRRGKFMVPYCVEAPQITFNAISQVSMKLCIEYHTFGGHATILHFVPCHQQGQEGS
jgi:hypothetical protein